MFSVIKILVHLLCLVSFVRTWDLAVTVDGHIEFFNSDGSADDIPSQKFNHLTALAYDAVFQSLYFTDTQHDNVTIFQMNFTREIVSLVKKRIGNSVQAIAYDPVSGILYWTDANNRSIFWVSLSSGELGVGQILIQMTDETPQGIAVDSCRRFLYWTNSNYQKPTIERSKLDGSDREVIIKDDLFMPMGITVDPIEARLYWTDDKEGIYFRIEGSDLDGSDRRILHHGSHQEPYNIAIAAGTIYWTDWVYKSVWSLSLQDNNTKPNMVITFQDAPIGIIAKQDILKDISNNSKCIILEETFKNKTRMVEEQNTLKTEQEKNALIQRMETLTKNYTFCLNGGIRNKTPGSYVCKCPMGFSGARCETSICYNYCFEGSCVTNNEGSPFCRCFPGYAGERCQYNLCDGFCLNGGKCVTKNRIRQCFCPEDATGERCENLIRNEIASKCSPPVTFDESPENETVIRNHSVERSVLQEDIISSIDGEASCFNGQIRDPILMAIAALCIILSSVCAYLTHKVMELKKRPRIKKRIIVNKNVTQLTSRPEPKTQCEITIENCCNMNICETPCFEPQGMRTAIPVDANKKDEKKNLLMNMEHPEDLY